MPGTRATKQESVLEHISSLPEANDLVVSISEIVVDPQVADQVLNDSLAQCKEMHADLSSTLKDLKEFCSDPDVARDRKSTRLNSSHNRESRMPSSA